MSPLIKKISFFALLLLLQLPVFAQDSSTPPPPDRTPPSGLPLPVDEQIVFLVLAGLALGAFYLIKTRRLKQQA